MGVVPGAWDKSIESVVAQSGCCLRSVVELHHEFRGQGLSAFQSENLNHLSMLAGGTSCCSLLSLLRVVRRFAIGSAVIRRVHININDPHVEEPAALLEFLFTVTIGQKAIVADSHEALRQDAVVRLSVRVVERPAR